MPRCGLRDATRVRSSARSRRPRAWHDRMQGACQPHAPEAPPGPGTLAGDLPGSLDSERALEFYEVRPGDIGGHRVTAIKRVAADLRLDPAKQSALGRLHDIRNRVTYRAPIPPISKSDENAMQACCHQGVKLRVGPAAHLCQFGPARRRLATRLRLPGLGLLFGRIFLKRFGWLGISRQAPAQPSLGVFGCQYTRLPSSGERAACSR